MGNFCEGRFRCAFFGVSDLASLQLSTQICRTCEKLSASFPAKIEYEREYCTRRSKPPVVRQANWTSCLVLRRTAQCASILLRQDGAHFAGRVEVHGRPVFCRVCGPMPQAVVLRIAGSGQNSSKQRLDVVQRRQAGSMATSRVHKKEGTTITVVPIHISAGSMRRSSIRLRSPGEGRIGSPLAEARWK